MNNITGELILAQFKDLGTNQDETFEYIAKYKLDDEIQEILKLNGDILCENLMKFSIRYGILSILRFMYEHLNFNFNISLINEYAGINDSQKSNNMVDMSNAITSDGSVATESDGIQIAMSDKYSYKRNECITYMLQMKKYSTLTPKNKRFYYTFNKKKYGHISLFTSIK